MSKFNVNFDTLFLTSEINNRNFRKAYRRSLGKTVFYVTFFAWND